MSHDDFKFEPVPGLPEALPEGEHILWQGAPDARHLARDAWGLRWVAGYFVLLAVWRVGVSSRGRLRARGRIPVGHGDDHSHRRARSLHPSSMEGLA